MIISLLTLLLRLNPKYESYFVAVKCRDKGVFVIVGDMPAQTLKSLKCVMDRDMGKNSRSAQVFTLN